MNKNPHLLSLEVNPKSAEAFLHIDTEGIDMLIRSLERLKKKLESGEVDHDHFMTEDWGGWELTNRKYDPEGNTELIHHLKVYGWTSSKGPTDYSTEQDGAGNEDHHGA